MFRWILHARKDPSPCCKLNSETANETFISKSWHIFYSIRNIGLGVYSNSSDEESEEEAIEKSEEQSDWEPDTVLKVRIPPWQIERSFE